MAEGNNKLRSYLVIVSVMSTLIVAGVIAVFSQTTMTSSAQAEHESAPNAHPVIQQAVVSVTDDVDEIGQDVRRMVRLQERQTVLLEELKEDVSELKETIP